MAHNNLRRLRQIPGRVPTACIPLASKGWVLFAGAAGGIIGFFIIPVVGLIVGFIAGVFLAEAARLKTFTGAWPTTMQAMKSAGWSVLIEFGTCLLAAAVWVGGVVFVG